MPRASKPNRSAIATAVGRRMSTPLATGGSSTWKTKASVSATLALISPVWVAVDVAVMSACSRIPILLQALLALCSAMCRARKGSGNEMGFCIPPGCAARRHFMNA
ncbi:MAG TPA: hypothetical protein VHA77_11585 [Xanthobacteraceae bacterium]|nr:hypothetical protein [Xanthobacteraceae bacterium]